MKRVGLLMLVALAGCSSQPEDMNDIDVVNLSKQGSSASLPAPELANGKVENGSWTFQASAAGAAASFGVAGKPADFSIRCDPAARSMVFVRTAELAPGGVMMKIATGQGASTYPAVQGNEDRPVAIAKAVSSDTFLTNVLAKTTGGFGVILGDGNLFLMPYSTAIAQVISSCPH